MGYKKEVKTPFVVRFLATLIISILLAAPNATKAASIIDADQFAGESGDLLVSKMGAPYQTKGWDDIPHKKLYCYKEEDGLLIFTVEDNIITDLRLELAKPKKHKGDIKKTALNLLGLTSIEGSEDPQNDKEVLTYGPISDSVATLSVRDFNDKTFKTLEVHYFSRTPKSIQTAKEINESGEEKSTFSTWSIIAILFILALIVSAISSIHQRIKRKRMMKINQASLMGVFNHTTGLPIPENTPCVVYSKQSMIEINANGAIFNLAKNKIIDLCTRTDVDMQKSYTSSAGGAVGGAILFGAVGALIGGRSKQKEIKKISTFLIFTYQKEEGIDYIGFNVTDTTPEADKFVKEFATYKTAQTKVFDI